MQHPNIATYLPDEPDLPKTPKQWIVNICTAVIGQPFKTWVAAQMEARNAAMKKKKEMMIDMDPEMAAKFNASTHVSRKYALCSLLGRAFISPSLPLLEDHALLHSSPSSFFSSFSVRSRLISSSKRAVAWSRSRSAA